jgi:hypothetical protein
MISRNAHSLGNIFGHVPNIAAGMALCSSSRGCVLTAPAAEDNAIQRQAATHVFWPTMYKAKAVPTLPWVIKKLSAPAKSALHPLTPRPARLSRIQ